MGFLFFFGGGGTIQRHLEVSRGERGVRGGEWGGGCKTSGRTKHRALQGSAQLGEGLFGGDGKPISQVPETCWLAFF